jgi:hypothetical protein
LNWESYTYVTGDPTAVSSAIASHSLLFAQVPYDGLWTNGGAQSEIDQFLQSLGAAPPF